MKKDLRSLSIDELKNELSGLEIKSFAASQIFDWLHAKTVDSFDEMTNISKDLRKKLDETYFLARSQR